MDNNVAIVENVLVDCPLFGRQIATGYCYDVNMVIGGFIKPDILNDVFDSGAADITCKQCKFNPEMQ